MSRSFVRRLGVLVLLLALLAVLAPTAGAAGPDIGWVGLYFNGVTDSLNCAHPQVPNLVRLDPKIDFFWREHTSPAPGHIDKQDYGVCWYRAVYFDAGNWTFYTLNDDGMNVTVDNRLAVNGWGDQPPNMHTGTIHLNAGWHVLTVQYYNRGLGGTACVDWAKEGAAFTFRCSYPTPTDSPGSTIIWSPGRPIDWGTMSRYVPTGALPPGYQLPVQLPSTYRPPIQIPPIYKPPLVPKPPAVCYYQVQWGDTLTSIAFKYNTTIWAIALANGIQNANLIYAGMVLKIPGCK